MAAKPTSIEKWEMADSVWNQFEDELKSLDEDFYYTAATEAPET